MNKKLVFLLVLLVVVSLFIFAYYFFRLSQTSRPQKKIESETKQDVKGNAIDVLSLPGWAGFTTLTHLPDSSIQVTSPDRASELRVLNRTDFIKIGNGLELSVKMHAVSKADPSSPRTSRIILFDEQLATKQKIKPRELRVGFDQEKYLVVEFSDSNLENVDDRKKDLVTVQDGKKLSSDKLKIEIVPDGQDKIFNIFDGATGELLIKDLKPPAPVLDDDLNVGFYPQAGDLGGVVIQVNTFTIIKK